MVGAVFETPSDELTVRGGVSEHAWAELYRLHWEAGVAFAYSLTGNQADAEDLASQSFLKILAAVRAGAGPTGPFRPYLYRAIRTCAVDLWRRRNQEHTVDHVPDAGAEDPGFAGVDEGENRQIAAQAFASLPARWQEVIHHTDVLGLPPRQVAPVVGIAPNAVSALYRRARRGLREAYLTEHAGAAPKSECVPFRPLLARALMGTASARDTLKLDRHLQTCCGDCAPALERLRDIQASMRDP